MPSIH